MPDSEQINKQNYHQLPMNQSSSHPHYQNVQQNINQNTNQINQDWINPTQIYQQPLYHQYKTFPPVNYYLVPHKIHQKHTPENLRSATVE